MSNDNSLRDKLSAEFALSKFPMQNIETSKYFTQDVNFARRMTHCSAYKAGWDAARSNAGQVVDEKLWLECETLKRELERYEHETLTIQEIRQELQQTEDTLQYAWREVDKLRTDNEALKLQVERVVNLRNQDIETIRKRCDERDQLRDQLAKAKAALEFYQCTLCRENTGGCYAYKACKTLAELERGE